MPDKHDMIVEVLCDGPTGPEARDHQRTIEIYYTEATERGLDFFEALHLARVTWVKEFLND